MGKIENVIDELYENDKEFEQAYDVLREKIMKAGLEFGVDTIIDMADKYEEG